MAHHYTGRGVPHQVLTKAIELEACAAERPPVTWRARSNLGLFLKWADDFEGARPILMAMCQDAADEGDESSLPDLLWSSWPNSNCGQVTGNGPPVMRMSASRRPSGPGRRS